MKRIKYIIYAILAVVFIGLVSCSEMDDYRKFTDGNEILYTGKVDSVLMMGGKNRVVFTGLLMSDPKITSVKIYWNVRNDSLVIPIVRSAGIDTLMESIPLSEGVYNFEIFTFDDGSNRSIPVNATGISYGANYASGLYNRLVKQASLADNNVDVVVEWYNGSEDSPYTEVDYTDINDVQRVVKVTPKKDETILEQYKIGTAFTVKTYFVPEEMVVDTFVTESTTYRVIVTEDVTNQYFTNYQAPFTYDVWDGSRWGTLEGWTANAAMLSRGDGLYGGYDDYQEQDNLGLERWGGGENEILNGKLYQTFTLPEGKYTFSFFFGNGSSTGNGAVSNNGSDPRFIAAAAGEGLPDVDDLSTSALAYSSLVGVAREKFQSITFTLEEETEVSMGVVVNWSGTEQNIRAYKVQLMSTTEK